MPNAKDLSADGYLKILTIGRSGSRKSSVAASFPKPMYSFDLDGRIQAMRGQDIDYDQYPRIAGWGKFTSKVDQLVDQGRKNQKKYETIHIGSITTALSFWLWEAKQHYASDTKGGFRIIRPNTNNALLMSDKPHFKYVHAALDVFINDCIIPLSFFYNVIVEAHETTVFDKEGNPMGEKMLASDSIAEIVPSTFNETWQFKFEKSFKTGESDKYYIYFRNHFLAKTTFRQLPDRIEITNKENVFYDELLMPILRGEKR